MLCKLNKYLAIYSSTGFDRRLVSDTVVLPAPAQYAGRENERQNLDDESKREAEKEEENHSKDIAIVDGPTWFNELHVT
jgi:hypothetical protein